MMLKILSLSLLLIVMLEIPKTRAATLESGKITISNKATGQEVIYVNAIGGDDQGGRGTENSPFKTITQALMLANPDSLIILSPGTYSLESGETFPLVLSNNVNIQGYPRSQGYNVIINGGGDYISPTGAGQNVTIVATKTAGKLTGVTVINPNQRGYGLWVESANLEITQNTFTRNGASGIAVNGTSKPIITRNHFYHNRGNGLIIYGTSDVEVRDNTFEKTGFGISVMEDAKIRLDNNQIIGNRIGVIVEENAQATLRRNVIEQSTENGLVAIANSRVDLGTSGDLGENLFRGNRGLDIRNLTQQTITAVGTQIEGNVEGAVDFENSGNSPVVDSPENPIYIPVPPPETPQPVPTNTNYRVIVSVSEQQEKEIRRLYSDAFATVYSGQRVLQVGLFNSWSNAQQVLEKLKELGLKEIIILID